MASRNFDELRAKMAPQRRARNDESAQVQASLIRLEMQLDELRQRMGLTQADMAARMGVTQPALSMMESREDMLISTMRRMIESLGGRMELTAHMPEGLDVSIQFKHTEEQPEQELVPA